MRGVHRNNAIPDIQKWVLERFEAAGKSQWEYVEYCVYLKDVDVNPTISSES